MKTKTTKLSVLAFLGLGLAVYGQSGKVGINTSNPEATLDVQPSSTNLAGSTNEGFIAPKLSKQRVAQTDAPKEGTLVYVDNTSFTTIDGTKDARVTKITEKGYYYYNGTEWVKSTTVNNNIWINDIANTTVKINNLSDGVVPRTNDKNLFVMDNGQVYVGTQNDYNLNYFYPAKFTTLATSPVTPLIPVNTEAMFSVTPGGLNVFRAVDSAVGNKIIFERARGSFSSLKPLQTDDELGLLEFRTYSSDRSKGAATDGVRIDAKISNYNSEDDFSAHLIIYTRALGQNKPNNYFYFGETGNMGIGILSPTEKLEVAGKVKATAFMGASGATIFPDYVFQKYYTGTSSLKADYSFKTLSQVENFVKTNGHLPGYQSAAEIKKQGYIDLMATQLTNVEKIEELYLHLLEKDKEIKELKERLEKLEKLLQK
ncbi:hypothetical protein PG637_01420 [Riemerella anatipestifer]|nr:hypothetical protein [Riemerella anatipestifer]MDY3324329.1 hypothetical protein [Riemerella anatipestifer]MDY3353144.1 hypothetical protein [Riemerella anatipestifer]